MHTELPSIPGYRITGQLGQGSFGIVFAAELETDPSSHVAIKVMKGGVHVRLKEVQRFRREGKVARELQHENILPILATGRSGDLDYIVMERVDGETFQQRIARRREIQRTAESPEASNSRATLADDLKILAAICRAAGYAHRHGVIHRDLKPGNILVRSDGHPFLIDFGLARHLQGGSTLTSSGVVVGTFFYMAPEQLMGDTKKIGPASDIYSLGATLYALCTGRPPLTGRTYEELRRKVLEDEVPRALPGLPKGLEAIWLRALEKEPQHRYPTALEMAEDLERVAAGLKPQRRGPPMLALRGWRSLVRERRALIVSLILALGALVILLGWRARGKEEVEMERLFFEGDLALLRDELSTALQLYGEAAELRPGDFESYLRMAAACSSFELREQAQSFIEAARSRGFDIGAEGATSPREVYCRALYKLWSEDLEGAERGLRGALLLDPEFFPSHLALSRIEQRRGELQSAEQHLGQYQSFLASRYPSWTVAQAQTLELEGRFEDSLKVLVRLEDDVEQGSPGSFRLHSNRGRILLRLTRWPEARAELERAISWNDRDAATWANFALAQLRMGMTDQARSSSSRALLLDPSSTTAHSIAGWLAVQSGLNAEAEQHLRAARPAMSAEDAGRLRKAEELYEDSERARDEGREVDAIDLCRRALEFDQEHFGALLALAQDEAGLFNLERAVELYERAQIVAQRLAHPLSLGRDLWNSAYYNTRNLLILAQGRFSTHSSLGHEEAAREANGEVLALFERSPELDPVDVVNYADAVASSPIDALKDWCTARHWLESNKLAKPLDTVEDSERLLAVCRSRCP